MIPVPWEYPSMTLENISLHWPAVGLHSIFHHVEAGLFNTMNFYHLYVAIDSTGPTVCETWLE